MAAKKKKSAKTYVLDTNVLLHDCSSMFAFEENDVIIPMVVLEELDNHKSRQDEVGANARSVSRSFDELREKGSLFKGVQLPSGGMLSVRRIEKCALDQLPVELRPEKNDHLIIALMLEMMQLEPWRSNCGLVLVSKDINVRVKCDALGISSEDYKHTRVASSLDELYTGVAVVTVSDDVIAQFYSGDGLPASAVGEFYPNQIVVLKPELNGCSTTLTKCVDRDGTLMLVPIKQIDDSFGLKPRNKEQSFALDLLYDENVKLVTLTGRSGGGKSLIALAAALDQLKGLGSKGKYDKLIIMRPIQPVGKEIGFLPGSLDEKLAPWIAPIEDALNFLMGARRATPRRAGKNASESRSDENEYLRLIQENGLIEIAAITFMRGRSIPNAMILLDEGQNLTIHEMKTLITRVSEGTKVLITGDLRQIDNHHIDAFTNGLSYIIEKFKPYSIAGHVTLIKGERSDLASLAADIL